MMLDCWDNNYLYRPRFKQLKSQLQTFDRNINEGKEEKDTIHDENIEKSSTDHQMLEITNGANPIEMESMAHTNRTELVLERQTSMMNEYTEESKMSQHSTIIPNPVQPNDLTYTELANANADD